MRDHKFIGFIFLLSLLFNKTAGQSTFNNWYFGNNAGITFNTNPPSSLTGSQMRHLEGCASISNSAGALLFYTDGISVWNKNHNVMPNGTGLMGNWSASQSALIVPFPGSDSKYYIFTVTDWPHNGDLRYSIVDMNLNAGNGDIIPTSKNILLSTNQTEKLVAANATNCGVWVLTHQRDNARFIAHLITSSGISAPVFSDAGSVHNSTPIPPDNYSNLTGVMKVSKNNLKIGLATLGRIIELFDFDPTTGMVSNPMSLPMSYPNRSYGVCFSPDNSKFYITEGLYSGFDIFQYDLSGSNLPTIINSRTLVGTATSNSVIGDMQIGPDNKIYFAKDEMRWLGTIPNPNLSAPACGFNNTAVDLGSGTSRAGLPNEIRSAGGSIEVNLGKDTTLCQGELKTLSAPVASTYLWSTGATTQNITVSATGQYWVSVGNGACPSADTINVTFSSAGVHLGNDTTLCQGQSLILNGGAAGNYLWSTGAITRAISVTTPGQYWVKTITGNCFKADTINIAFNPAPGVNLGNDTTLCQGQSLILDGGAAGNYLWSTGATSRAISVTTSGQYRVTVTTGNCFKADTINIAFNSAPRVDLGNDTTLCEGQSLILDGGAAGNYLWSTGATTRAISVTTSGQYRVKVTNGNCSKPDTINIDYKSPPAPLFPSDTTICNNQILTLDAGGSAKYLWSTGEITQVIKVSQSSSYWVNINYANTCQKQFSIIVRSESCDCFLFMPNAFTPNSDGLNDIFKPARKSGCQFLRFSIFNKYGQIVFETTDLNKGWDGKFQGLQQNNGVFVWMVTAIKDGQRKVFNGTVTLIR